MPLHINENITTSTTTTTNNIHNNNNNNNNGSNEQQATVREITQTDKLNKLLLESVLKRLSKTGEIDKFVGENQHQEDDIDNTDF
ncbi:hypothetical protein HCN44_001350 [Aphidius gifuensis]|uniref:Uncharacterized protein n=1 Tax=Aphidius gifuensis TaxID=684658 RepID=A0A834XR97_APHGI|nr:hypothetical protein HCN44_001350 [Aphidius gifuensis]